MIEEERIFPNLGSSRVDLLQETLKSHRLAVDLDPENRDVLFNTAQVESALAESLIENGLENRSQANELLQEAISIFDKCYDRQRQEWEELQAALANANAEEEQAIPQEQSRPTEGMEISSEISDAPSEWYTVVESVTPQALLDTCTAQLQAINTLIDSTMLFATPTNNEEIIKMGLDIAKNKMPFWASKLDNAPGAPEEKPCGPVLSIGAAEEETSPKNEALLVAANFQATVAEDVFRNGKMSASQFAAEVERIYAPLVAEIVSSSTTVKKNVLSAYADALNDFASAVSERPRLPGGTPRCQDDLGLQWTALSQAQKFLTKLSSDSSYSSSYTPAKLADIYLSRGDTDLFRFSLSLQESAKPAWVQSKGVLVSNAGALYRGARAYAERTGAVTVQKTADAKALVAEVLKQAASGAEVVPRKWGGSGDELMAVLEQMVMEGVLDVETAEGAMKYF